MLSASKGIFKRYLLSLGLLWLLSFEAADAQGENPFAEDSHLTYPIERDRQIFELQLAPTYTLGPYAYSLGIGVAVTPQVRLKMFDAASSPVRTPSYMPRVALLKQFPFARSNATLLLAFAHHSNGQSGETFVVERLSAEAGDAPASFDISPSVLDEQLDAATVPSTGTIYFGHDGLGAQFDTLVTYLTGQTSLNTESGSFSTNYLELGGVFSWQDVWHFEVASLGVSHEIHPAEGVWFFRTSRKIRDVYGRRRTNLRIRVRTEGFQAESALTVIDKWKTDRWHESLTCSEEEGVKLCRYDDILFAPVFGGRFVNRNPALTFSLTLSLSGLRTSDFGKFSFFGRFWFGQNYYNIRFAEEDLKQVMFGISRQN